jgi:glycosyltransferase involved in cell wall biosynthesis
VSSCPEVAGDAALTVDPGNPEEIADALREIVSDGELSAILRNKGLKRAQDFDFRKTAEETLKVYEEIYGR